jgi:hypothetical protein
MPAISNALKTREEWRVLIATVAMLRLVKYYRKPKESKVTCRLTVLPLNQGNFVVNITAHF